MERIDWTKPEDEDHEAAAPLHGPGCTCNEDSGNKLFFARIVMNLCAMPTATHPLAVRMAEYEQMVRAAAVDQGACVCGHVVGADVW